MAITKKLIKVHEISPPNVNEWPHAFFQSKMFHDRFCAPIEAQTFAVKHDEMQVKTMISVEEAVKRIRENFPLPGTMEFPFGEIHHGEILEDIRADRDYPPFHRVMMDGIAVNYNVYQEGKREFPVLGLCPAGEPQKELTDPAGAFEVMTGSPLPLGTDLVIPYEHLEIKNNIAIVREETKRVPLENVHLKGSDAHTGDVLLATGNILNGPHWGIAASVGHIHVNVRRKPRINIISTGDELVEVFETPLNHQIRRSNAYALKASLKLFGHDEVELSHLPDNTVAIEEHFEMAKTKYDVLIYSGGVSQGKFDYLPSCWKKLGVREIFHGVSQRPGKPLWFGVDDSTGTTVIGLPGNPVSSLVCLHRYFLEHREIYAELTEDITFKKDFTHFVPVKIEFSKSGIMKAHPLKIQNSGEFSALAGSDGFIELPKEKTLFRTGEAFLFHPWRPM